MSRFVFMPEVHIDQHDRSRVAVLAFPVIEETWDEYVVVGQDGYVRRLSKIFWPLFKSYEEAWYHATGK